MFQDIWGLVKEIEPDLIGWRRELHEIPEISYDLPETTDYIEKKLRSFGIDQIRTGVGKSGIVADICGKNPGKCLALRADVDGLPVTEDSAAPVQPKHLGKMHACGHDAHAAMLLAAAKILNEHKNEFDGTVRLIFQPAEEGPPPGGAYSMIQDGVLDGVDAIYGMHIMATIPKDQVVFCRTNFMSALDCFTIELTGKGGHGSMPHKCVDAITLAAQVVNNLQYVVSRQTDPAESVVVHIGTIHGGDLWNIVAEKVTLTGTVRSFDPKVREATLAHIERGIKGTCEIVGASYKFTNMPAVDPLVNNADASGMAEEVIEELLGKEHLTIPSKPFPGTDDFAYYLSKVPGAYLALGCTEGPESNFEHHSPHFCIGEGALKTGTAIHLALVNKYLNSAIEFKPNS